MWPGLTNHIEILIVKKSTNLPDFNTELIWSPLFPGGSKAKAMSDR